ncbi:MAG: peptide ABC transporter substrate-binding protein [Pigmentiphaga sp.]|nr:peptide ABC transporter substrate-binding protein [Pigmentiphaga sp.]
MKRFSLAALALAAAVLAAPAHAQTLKVGIIGDPASLNPTRITGGVWEEDVLRDLFAGLVEVSKDGQLVPGVATAWNLSEDGKTYTFTLRESQWSDGTPLTADDFVYAWRYVLDPKNAVNTAHRLYPIANAEAIAKGEQAPDSLGVRSLDGGKILEVTLNEPSTYFLSTLVLPVFYPLPRQAIEAHGNAWSEVDNIVVNGPFVPTRWITGSELNTRKNTHYYDAADVEIDGVTFFPIEDRDSGITRFRAGDLDVLRDFPASQYEFLKQELPDATRLAPRLGSYYLSFNLRDGRATADPRVREALSLAINREVIASQLLENAVLPLNSFLPTGLSQYTAQPQAGLDAPYAQRRERAAALLKEAGYGPDKPLKLGLSFNSGSEHQRIAVAVAAQWKPLGVLVELSNTEANVHYANLRAGDYDVGRAAWLSSYDDPQNFLQLLYTPTNNYGLYRDDTFNRLYEQANLERDPVKRRELLEQAEARLAEAWPVAPIYEYASRNLVNPRLEGWEDNSLDIHPSRAVSFRQ